MAISWPRALTVLIASNLAVIKTPYFKHEYATLMSTLILILLIYSEIWNLCHYLLTDPRSTGHFESNFIHCNYSCCVHLFQRDGQFSIVAGEWKQSVDEGTEQEIEIEQVKSYVVFNITLGEIFQYILDKTSNATGLTKIFQL